MCWITTQSCTITCLLYAFMIATAPEYDLQVNYIPLIYMLQWLQTKAGLQKTSWCVFLGDRIIKKTSDGLINSDNYRVTLISFVLDFLPTLSFFLISRRANLKLLNELVVQRDLAGQTESGDGGTIRRPVQSRSKAGILHPTPRCSCLPLYSMKNLGIGR